MKKNLLITCVMLLFAVVSMAQNKITVSGVVSDKTGMTVIGATVSVKGAPQQGVVTGLDGDYKITNVPSNAVLLYSYIGMKDQEIAVNGRTTINVVMQEDNMLIDEVVVVGYRYIGVNQTFHEQHNIHHTRSNENDNIGKSPDYG